VGGSVMGTNQPNLPDDLTAWFISGAFFLHHTPPTPPWSFWDPILYVAHRFDCLILNFCLTILCLWPRIVAWYHSWNHGLMFLLQDQCILQHSLQAFRSSMLGFELL
jgi:hypothetical protein